MSIMLKTVSESCNLACSYCYYSRCQGRPGKTSPIATELLERLFKQYLRETRTDASFIWQGGEPLMAGIDFFKEAIRLQKKYARGSVSITNTVQTNATLINDEWAAFFRQQGFIVGVSLDGPQPVNDKNRMDSAGRGSFERTVRGIERLKHHGVETSILSVISPDNVDQPESLMAFFEQSGYRNLHFIPCMDFASQQSSTPAAYKITAAEYGSFLCRSFDVWFNGGNPSLSVRLFDNLVNLYASGESELCHLRGACTQMLVVEQNGQTYPCDFYINNDWALGFIGQHSLQEILSSSAYRKFGKLKSKLSEDCLHCRWRTLCEGGCPRNRTAGMNASSSSRDYFCDSYRQLFEHVDTKMRMLGKVVRHRWFEYGLRHGLGGRMPGKNDLCACGSGRKYKHCCTDIQRIKLPPVRPLEIPPDSPLRGAS
jgi:uncharacterized protein